LCIPEAEKFRDYRLQLLSWEEVERELTNCGEQAGISTGPETFVAQLRSQLEERGRTTDKGFPNNRYLRFENGEAILTPVEATPDPEGLDHALSQIRGHLEPIETHLRASSDDPFQTLSTVMQLSNASFVSRLAVRRHGAIL
jgi:hypothetical protein